MEEIKKIADYCLNCKTRPCSKKGCPIETNIPEFITSIKNAKYEEAYNILMENNIFSHVCSIVCPQENQCEGSCIRGIKSEPTQIGKLEKFVNEWAEKNNYKYKIQEYIKNGKKVAIIGSGPAGLECATELLKNGFDIDIYEKDDIPGGILVYGIPDFRLEKQIVENIVNNIKQMGAKIHTNVEFGKDITLKELQEKYDAVFLGVGAPKSSVYTLTEEKVNSIYKSDEFLKAYSEKNFIKKLGTVVVIGGGNVAMDCARAAVKMGATSVKILYRRDREHMPAREIELKEALNDGVEFKELTRVITANVKDEKIESVNCVRTEIINEKAIDIENAEEFKETANTIVFAIGLKPDKNLLESQGITLNEWGYIDVDENGKTSLDKIYAGGDLTESKSTVCRALAAGKRAANGIIKEFLNK